MRLRKLLVLVAVVWSGQARAAISKWEFGKQEDVPKAVWKAAINGGLVLNTGNANNLAFTAGGTASTQRRQEQAAARRRRHLRARHRDRRDARRRRHERRPRSAPARSVARQHHRRAVGRQAALRPLPHPQQLGLRRGHRRRQRAGRHQGRRRRAGRLQPSAPARPTCTSSSRKSATTTPIRTTSPARLEHPLGARLRRLHADADEGHRAIGGARGAVQPQLAGRATSRTRQ